MVAIVGNQFTRRHEVLALVSTAVAAVVSVIVPTLYVVAVPLACAAMATLAPTGRRTLGALAVWAPLSMVVLVATTLTT